MAKPRCPACGSNRTGHWKNGLLMCHRCGGRWDETDMDEGGDFDDRRPDERLIREESGGATGYAIRQQRELNGGLS